MKHYYALIDGEPGAYGVAFPDCPGCTAMGSDEREANANAIEALSEWMRDVRAVGVAPEPRTVEALRNDPEVQAALGEGSRFVIVPLMNDTDRSLTANIRNDRRAGLTADLPEEWVEAVRNAEVPTKFAALDEDLKPPRS